MNDEAKQFIREQLQAGQTHNDIWRELISQGYGANGFEQTYIELVKELGLDDPRLHIEEQVTAIPDYDGAPRPVPAVFELVKNSLASVFQNFAAVIAASVIGYVLFLVLTFLPTTPTATFFGPVFLVVWSLALPLSFLIFLITVVALFYMVQKAEYQANFINGLEWATQNLFSILWLVFLMSIIVAVGGALVVPGVLFLSYGMFAPFVLVRGSHNGLSAIVRSIDLVAGSFFKVTGRMLVLFVLMFVWLSLFGIPAFILLGLQVPALAGIPAVLGLMSAVVLKATFIKQLYVVQSNNKVLFDASLYRGVKWLLRLALLVGFVAIGAGVWFSHQAVIDYVNQYTTKEYQVPSGASESSRQGGLGDTVLRTKVDEAYASGNYYHTRLQSYDGVCTEAFVADAVKCVSGEESLLMFAQLGDGSYYCRDHTGFKGSVPKITSTASCN